MTKEQSRELDLLLQTILDKKVNVRSLDEIHQNVFPDKTFEYCSSLFHIADNFHQQLLDSIKTSIGYIFTPTHYVVAFLHDGGFTKYFDTEFAKQEAEIARQKLNDEKLSGEVDIVKFQRGLGKRFTIWAFIVSIIAVIVSILTTVVTEHKKENQPLIFDTLSLKKQLHNIETRIEKLENKQLKDTLTK